MSKTNANECVLRFFLDFIISGKKTNKHLTLLIYVNILHSSQFYYGNELQNDYYKV